MKFPESLLNVDDYYQTIENLLDDDECQIFLDTNIFALFFKFHSAARQDFFEWINPLISKKRINTPVWALNEYTNRFIRRKASDYIDTLTKLKPFENQFLEIKRFLEMNIDTDNLHSRFYSSRENYLTDLKIV